VSVPENKSVSDSVSAGVSVSVSVRDKGVSDSVSVSMQNNFGESPLSAYAEDHGLCPWMNADSVAR
jgi:hypothetical protein